MNIAIKCLAVTALSALTWHVARAQPAAASPTPPAKPSSAQSEAGEPRADTSSTPAATPRPSAAAKAAPGPAGKAAVNGRSPSSDRLDLGTATVTGSQEQPKVMYIVPWKRSDIGDLAGKPMNSLVDEILSPVDREVFKREVVYYQAVQGDASQNGASTRSSPQGEK
jgi:hypothetical protein